MATQTKGFYVHNWGTWGWIETGVKAIGIAAGIIGFFTAASAVPASNDINHPVAVIILGLSTLLCAGVIVGRFIQREIISILYAIANFLGHAGMLFYLIRAPQPGLLIVIFGAAYIVGELVKQRFLSLTGYTEAGAQPAQMMMFSRVQIVNYLIITIAALL